MDCPLTYQKVITSGNLVLKYFSKTMNSSCCWYALKEAGGAFEVLTSSDKQEIIAVYKNGKLIYLNKVLLKSPFVLTN